jgi:hypothetical protein
MEPAEIEGTLVVVVLKARNLRDKHFYKQDVYVVVSVEGTTQKTPVDIKGGQHPLWDHEMRFPVAKCIGDKARNLEIVCWSKEPRVDEVIASGQLSIRDTLRTGEFDDWIPLFEPTGSQRGDVYLEMTFFSNAPPPVLPVPLKTVKKPAPGPHFSPHIIKDMNAPLQRRPTKLQPSERLSRLPDALTPSKPQYHGLHPSAAPSSSASLGARSVSHSPPPTSQTPNFVPQSLHHSGPPSPVPSTLRPGQGNSACGLGHVEPKFANPQHSIQPNIVHHNIPPSYEKPDRYLSSVAPPSSSTSYSSTSFSPPKLSHLHPMLPVSQTPNQHTIAHHSAKPVYTDQHPVFPQPHIPGGTSPPRLYYPSPPTDSSTTSALPDPYLIARYQTPLPLPGGASSTPSSANNYPRTFSSTKSPRDMTSASIQADMERLQAQRMEEELLRSKKEQEVRDMELAKQLDRELNL